MNALRVFFVCVVLFAAFCRANEAEAALKWDGFFLGTLGVHTANNIPFGGVSGYFGVDTNGRGLGVLSSYALGGTTIQGNDIQFQVANFSFAVKYRIGRSAFIVSQGIVTANASLEDLRESIRDYSTALSVLVNPKSRLLFFGQARLQGQGIMLTAGIGF